MNMATQRALNLPYELLPPPTERELEHYAVSQEREATPAPPPPGVLLAEERSEETPSRGRPWHHPTVKQLRLLMVAWSIIAMAIATTNGDYTLAAALIPYNIFAYLILRWAQVPRKMALIPAGVLGIIFPLAIFTGINSVVILVAHLITLAISLEHMHRGTSPRGLPLAAPHWIKAPGTPHGAYYADIPTSLRPSWGSAGAHIASNSSFGSAGRMGARGEAIVGEALNTWAARYPHVRVFHGLCFTPGKPGADVDHAVLINNQLFLIDAKYWGHASYGWGRARGENGNEVLKNGAPFPGSSVHMDAARDKWGRYVPRGVSVDARICAVNEGGDPRYPMNNAGAPSGVALTDLENLTRELDIAVRNGHQRFLNRYALRAITAQLQ